MNKDLLQAQCIYSAKQSMAWGFIFMRVWCRHCPAKHCSHGFPSVKELLRHWQGCAVSQTGILSGLQQSGLAKEPCQGSARDAAEHIFCISFFFTLSRKNGIKHFHHQLQKLKEVSSASGIQPRWIRPCFSFLLSGLVIFLFQDQRRNYALYWKI